VDEHTYFAMARFIRESALEATGESDVWVPARLYGYSGHIFKGVFLGRGTQGVLVQASGVAADAIARAIPHPDNVSRIDIAYTVWSDTDATVRIARASAEVAAHKPRQGGRPPRRRLINGFGSGDTLYIGTRGKESIYMRVYDKGAESKLKEYEGATRYELELTDTYARDAFHSLRDVGMSHYSMVSMAAGYWEKRGISLPEMPDVIVLTAIDLPRKEEDAERRFRWLEECVRPSLRMLLEKGYSEARIAQALDIGDAFVIDYGGPAKEPGRVPRGSPRRRAVVNGLQARE